MFRSSRHKFPNFNSCEKAWTLPFWLNGPKENKWQSSKPNFWEKDWTQRMWRRTYAERKSSNCVKIRKIVSPKGLPILNFRSMIWRNLWTLNLLCKVVLLWLRCMRGENLGSSRSLRSLSNFLSGKAVITRKKWSKETVAHQHPKTRHSQKSAKTTMAHSMASTKSARVWIPNSPSRSNKTKRRSKRTSCAKMHSARTTQQRVTRCLNHSRSLGRKTLSKSVEKANNQ